MGEITREEWLERRNSIDMKIQSHDDEIKRINIRLSLVEDMTKEIQQINLNIKLMLQKMDMHHAELEEQNHRLDELERVPSDRWNNLIGYILMALVSGAIGYFIKFR